MSRRRDLEVILKSEFVTIGELVRISDVRYSTLKFYTEEGMLPFKQADEGLVRRYDREKAMERLDYIKSLKDQGLSIKEIQEKLGL